MASTQAAGSHRRLPVCQLTAPHAGCPPAHVQSLGTNHPGREYQDAELLAFLDGGCWLAAPADAPFGVVSVQCALRSVHCDVRHTPPALGKRFRCLSVPSLL